MLKNLTVRVPPRRVTLSVNYRTPSEIMEVANRLLPAAAPGVEPARSVRSTGAYPVVDTVGAAGSRRRRLRTRARRASTNGGTVAVIAPPDLHPPSPTRSATAAPSPTRSKRIDAPIAVLSPLDAKGLEFDHVIVVEPRASVTPDAAGLRLLYVVLTRATRHLVVVHSEPLPEALGLSHRSVIPFPI